ncbi:sporulation protein YabP [Anaerotignum sp. MB30-C6]|uniref:sporulation protein YabP n=1 Tax=Anaerotignum sp. MB30-C6 TaxID=3070814 RepID=UPI0027DDAC82|nr:sporulation protein YabP [Anaerotignum sp. MB30-C6]WMI81045.1 sporulation protein YabP [Anaerotignum sp. MB30-C6]
MAEDKKRSRHTVSMEERERIRMGGVLEVLSFDEEGVMLETECGLMMLKGTGLHMGKLDLDEGEVTIEGLFDSITYSDGALSDKHSFLGKLFR